MQAHIYTILLNSALITSNNSKKVVLQFFMPSSGIAAKHDDVDHVGNVVFLQNTSATEDRGEVPHKSEECEEVKVPVEPMEVLSYPEMSEQIACLYFQKTMMVAENARLHREVNALKQREQYLGTMLKNTKLIYGSEINKLRVEVLRLHDLANSFVNTL